MSHPPDDTSSDLQKNPQGKRDDILQAALHLFTTQGYHATPTSQISKEAGISTGTLFHYFPDKNTLFDQLYLTIKKDMAEVIRSRDDPALDPRNRLEQCFRGFISWGVANPEKVRFIEQFYHSPQVSDVIKREAVREFEWMIEIAEKAIKKGMVRDLPLDFYIVMIFQILFGVLALISSGTTGLSDEELTVYALDMVWNHSL